MAKNEFEFSTEAILKELPDFSRRGITELTVHDPKVSGDRTLLEKLLNAVKKNAPDIFISIPVQAKILDAKLINLLSQLNCSLEIPFEGTEKNGNLLFDKKLYSSKAALLNNAGLVFGFDMAFGIQKGDTFKAFRDRLDFAVSLYPNHIDFPQFVDELDPPSSGVYSSKDLDFSHGMAFACRTFYSAGRAVPWFNSVLKCLKITPSTFFADFEEWQQCNNCSLESGFVPESVSHEDIEKMQIVFLKQKFDEKNKSHAFVAVQDLVVLNGAFSRLVAEGQESVVDTSYNPDDLLSPYATEIASFVEDVTMESCEVKVFLNGDYPDYKIL